MSTRFTADKSEVDDLYKSAIENQNTSKSKTSNTVYTSTPTAPSKSTPRQINLPLNDSAIAKNQANKLVDSPEPDFDDSGDITQKLLQFLKKIKNNPSPLATDRL